MASILAKNNPRTLKTIEDQMPSDESCNCRNTNECTLRGKCHIWSVIIVKITTEEETFIGKNANSFKTRFSGNKK